MIHLKLAFRNLFNRKQNNLIKIISLAIGIAVVMVLFAKVSFDLSINSFYPDSDRIYKLGVKGERNGEGVEFGQVSGAIPLGMKAEMPEIEAATRFTFVGRNSTFYDKDRNKLKGTFILGDSCLFDVLPRPMIQGKAKEVLSKPMYVLVSKTIADNMGGNVVGKQITMDSYPNKAITIGGVFEDIPENASYNYDIIISMNSILNFSSWDGSNNWLGNDRYIGYVKLQEGVNPASLSKPIYDMQVKYQNIEKLKAENGFYFAYTLEKIADSFNTSEEVKRSVLLLSALGIALLFAAVLNYILFVVSALVDRAKHVAIHKSYGASQKNISSMMVVETFLHFFIAIMLAILLIFIFKDLTKSIFDVTVTSLFSLKACVSLGVILFIIFIGTALIPARMLASMPIIASLTRFRNTRREWKLSLLFIQFGATAFLISLLVIVVLQYDKMIKDDPGFRPENLVYSVGSHPKDDLAIEKIKHLPFVELVGKGSVLPAVGDNLSGNNVSLVGGQVDLFNIADLYWADESYIPALGMEIIEGSNFNANSSLDEILVSESFVERMKLEGWNDGVIGKNINISEHPGNLKIVGVYKNITLSSVGDVEQYYRPSAIFYNSAKTSRIIIKLSEVNGENIEQIQKIFEEVMPDKDVPVRIYSESLLQQYNEQDKFKTSVMIVGLVALIINMMGLVGYLKNEVQRRSAEISIRKINGATLSDILKLFIKDISWLATPALIFGSIGSYFAANKWMENFAVKIELSPFLFISCIIFLLILILLLVVLNCLKIANQNPIDSLKTE